MSNSFSMCICSASRRLVYKYGYLLTSVQNAALLSTVNARCLCLNLSSCLMSWVDVVLCFQSACVCHMVSGAHRLSVSSLLLLLLPLLSRSKSVQATLRVRTYCHHQRLPVASLTRQGAMFLSASSALSHMGAVKEATPVALRSNT